MSLTLKIDLLSLLKSSTSDKQKLNAFIPLIRNEGIKREFGERYIDKILERLDDGLGKDGKLKKYSKAYINSLTFQAYGKDPNTVNLELTGQMRADISVVRTTPTGCILGFTNDEQEQKAIGHVEGRGNLPKRDFWGLPKSEEINLMKEVIREFQDNNIDTIEYLESDNVETSQSNALNVIKAKTDEQDINFFIEDFEGDNG
jgi:hypothetical protein